MPEKRESDAKPLVMTTASTLLIIAIGFGALLIIAIGLGIAGYVKQGKQTGRIEGSQLELQTMVQTNARQMADDVTRIEENQSKLHAAVKDVQARAGHSSSNIIALKQQQTKLQQTVQENNQQLAGNIATLEQNQMRLRETVENSGNQLVTKIAAVDQNQRRFQSEIERLQGDIQTLATTSALEENLSTLQENLLSNARELADIIELIGQKQLKFEETIQGDIQTMANSVSAVERSQAKLQEQIVDVQARAGQSSTNITALKQEQIKLQETVQENNEQLVTSIAAVGQNQRRFQSAVERLQGDIQTLATARALEENLLALQENLRNSTRDLADIIELIGQKQLKFEEAIQSDIRTMANSIGAVERSQAKLQEQIADVQAHTEQSSTNMTALKQEQIKLQETVQEHGQQLAGNIATLDQKQMKLREIVQDNDNQLVTNIATVDQNQRRFQGEIEDLQGDIQTLATAGALEEHLLALQENLLNNMLELASIIELVGQKQLKFEDRIQSNIQTMANSIGAIERGQAKLQGQIADMQARTEQSPTDVNDIAQKQTTQREQIGDVQNEIQTMRKATTAVLEQLRVQLSQISSQISSVMAKREEASVAEVEQ